MRANVKLLALRRLFYTKLLKVNTATLTYFVYLHTYNAVTLFCGQTCVDHGIECFRIAWRASLSVVILSILFAVLSVGGPAYLEIQQTVRGVLHQRLLKRHFYSTCGTEERREETGKINPTNKSMRTGGAVVQQ